ncbi:MAG TPA: VTT domain-containing protein [Microlunatus sp.]|nr:VTT domain-containing protein [Microlunatus sp.]
MDFFRGLPFPLAVGALFVIVLVRAGGTYALGRGVRAGASRTSRVQRLVSSPRFVRAQELVESWGAPIVVLSFLTVGFQTVANLAAGVGRMPLRRYLPALVIGSLIWAFLYATVGLITVAALIHLYAISPVGTVLGGLALVAGLAGYIVWQVRRTHLSSAPQSTPDVVSAPKDGADRG